MLGLGVFAPENDFKVDRDNRRKRHDTPICQYIPNLKLGPLFSGSQYSLNLVLCVHCVVPNPLYVRPNGRSSDCMQDLQESPTTGRRLISDLHMRSGPKSEGREKRGLRCRR